MITICGIDYSYCPYRAFVWTAIHDGMLPSVTSNSPIQGSGTQEGF